MGRYYEKDGIKLPSVTTVISDCTDKSQALMQWASNCAVEHCKEHGITDDAKYAYKEISSEALDVGSHVHHAIEYFLRNGEEPTFSEGEDKALSGFLAFLEWFDTNKVQPLFMEQEIRSFTYAGTADFICKMGDKIYLIDFKTSKAIYRDYYYQVAAYREAWNMQYNPEITASGILRLDKETGLPEFKDISKTHNDDFEVFRCMTQLYYAKHPRIRKAAGL